MIKEGPPVRPTINESALDRIFESLIAGREPGAAIGVAMSGKPVYRKAFGRASIHADTLLSPSTPMRIASVSKQFVCLLYLLLCEEGKASIDDAIGLYLPHLHPISHPVTMRQLMSNSSGLYDALDINWQCQGVDPIVSSRELMAFYGEFSGVNVPPGQTWIYNNGGFLLLGAVIEKITGASLEVALKERIFEPLGMINTFLCRLDQDLPAGAAELHIEGGDGEFEASFRSTNLHQDPLAPSQFKSVRVGTAMAGEGGIVSSIDDMLIWLANMEHCAVGSKETWAVMTDPTILSNGTSTGYAMGLIVGDYEGLRTVYHPGGLIGGNAHLLKIPSLALDIMVIVNRADVLGTLLVNEVLKVVLPKTSIAGPRAAASWVETSAFRSEATGRVVELSNTDAGPIASA